MTRLCAASLICLGSLTFAAGCGGDEGDNHDVVNIELLRAGSGAEDPFVDTARIQVRLNYNQCLEDFYTMTNTEWEQGGEKGGPVFQEWIDRLCDRDVYDTSIDCEVAEIDQNLGSTSALNTSLKVTYTVLDPNLTRQRIFFGPLPNEDLVTDCRPEVKIDAGSVLGFNAAGEPIWEIESFTGFDTAYPGQNGPMSVSIRRSQAPGG